MQPQDPNQANQPAVPDPAATPIAVPAANTMDLPPRHSVGKTLLVILLILVLAGAAGAGTWYYMNKKLADQKKQQQAQADQLSAQVQDLQQQNAALKLAAKLSTTDQAAVDKTIHNFYDAWLKTGTAKDKAAAALTKGYISQDVVNYINTPGQSVDPVLCAQNIPTSYEYTDLVHSPTGATANVAFKCASSDSKSKIELTSATGNSWTISKISCVQ